MSNKKNRQHILAYLVGFIAIELFSYLALAHSSLNLLIFILLSVFCLVISIYSLEYGLLIALAELFIGSMGHLFIFPLGASFLSIRMAFWAIILIVFTVKFIYQLFKDKKDSKYLNLLKNFSAGKYFAILAFFVLVGFINAYLRHHAFALIFDDFNSWLYWLLLLPAVVIYGSKDEKAFQNLKILFLAAATWTSIKTLFLLFVFTHNLSFAPDIYNWLRRTLTGEITPTLSGWPRIFIQGQIYSGVALFLIFWTSLKKQKNIGEFILAGIFASAVLISFSRSFWVGLITALLFSFILIWRLYSFRKAIISGLWFIASIIFGFAIIYLVAIFPYPNPGKFSADFLDRVSNSNESAVTSRWSLLPVLGRAIIKEPFLGQGFGATITYHSSDPRVLQNNPDGQYTTYAFEWGYLDLWLKIGLFGLLAYLLLMLYLIKKSIVLGQKNDNLLLLGIGSSIIFLAATNFFTPYLNHPLGMGILILGACLI